MTVRRRSRILLFAATVTSAVGFLWSGILWSASPRVTPGQEQDFGDQLPRIAAKSPEESLREFELIDGFHMELVAAEPLVVDPVAIDFDASGRAYVVCMRGYSEQGNEQLGEVRLLEDADSDGRYDKSTIFAAGLSWPTAIACFDGGVFIGAAPDIVYCKDQNGDGVADVRKIVFSGFSRDNVQGLLNSFRWRLDNRIHVAVSTAGARIRTLLTALDGELISTEDAVSSDAIVLRGRDFSFDPRTLDIEIESGGGQHGMSFDDWGRKYVTSNSNHIQQVVIEDHYLRRNPSLPPTNPTAMIAADGPQAEVFRISPVEPWRILRTRLRVAGEAPGPIEGGGRAAGYFTGATGVTIYRGDAWPVEHRGLAFIGDVGSNIVHRKRLTHEYAGGQHVQQLAQRIDDGREFIASRENWFRPVQFANAPDGTLWVLDMYREVIEHPNSLPPSIKQHLDLTSGQDRGRVYRIAPDGYEFRPLPDLAAMKAGELVPYLAHANAWHRETAARRLFELQDDSVVPALKELVRNNEAPLGQLHAVYVLHGLGQLGVQDLDTAANSTQMEVRRHVAQLYESFLKSENLATREQARRNLLALLGDATPEMQFQLALSLGDVPDPERRLQGLLAILQENAADPWVRLAALTSTSGIAAETFVKFAGDATFMAQPQANEVFSALANLIIEERHGLSDVFAWLVETWETNPAVVAAYVRRLAPKLGKNGDEARAAFQADASGAKLYELMIADVEAVLRQRDASAAARTRAASLLWLAPWNDVSTAYLRLLTPQESPQVRAAAIEALGHVDEATAAELILDAWTSFTPDLRSTAEGVMFARPANTQALLTRVAAHELDRADFGPEFVAKLNVHPADSIRTIAAELFGTSSGARDDVIAEFQPALELTGDAERGFKLFERNCAKCHRRASIGHEIGPSLADTSAKTREQLLISVLDPNREVNPAYINYVASTEDGRVMTGVISAESATGITLKREEGQTQTVRRDELDVFSSTGKSIMPEGLEKEFNAQQFADLLEFLSGPDPGPGKLP